MHFLKRTKLKRRFGLVTGVIALTILLLPRLPTFLVFPKNAARELSAAATEPRVEPQQVTSPIIHRCDVWYVWCSSGGGDNGTTGRKFEFCHYLSALSAIIFVKPDSIRFYFDADPVVDQYHYHTWLSDISSKYDMFEPVKEPGCCLNGKPSATFIERQLTNRSDDSSASMYVHEDVIFTAGLGDQMTSSFATFVAIDDFNRTLIFKPKLSGNFPKLLSNTDHNIESSVIRCTSSDAYNVRSANSDSLPTCLILERRSNPHNIWELDSPLGRHLRTIAYREPAPAVPVPNYDELVPNIGHVVWIGGGEIKFNFFLACMSLLNVANVDALYIHGDKYPPDGLYWNMLRADRRVKFIYKTLGPFELSKSRPHAADIWRADILLEYGGIYLDVDAMMVQPLTRELRGFEAAATKDISTAVRTDYPDTLNMGVAIAKPNSRFWSAYRQAMRTYAPPRRDFFWLGVRVPYTVKERFPDTLHIDSHLQVLCYFSRCRPTWGPHYQNRDVNQRTTDILKNWRSDAFAFHFTGPTPFRFMSASALVSPNSRGLIADVGLNVLEKSNLTEYFVALRRRSVAALQSYRRAVARY